MNIILTKILRTTTHHKHPTTHLHTKSTNATNVDVDPLPVLGKSATFAKNQNVKSVINAVNLTVTVNDAVNVKDQVSQIVSANSKRNVAIVENRKRLLQTTAENALSSKYVRANSILQSYVQTYKI